MLHPEGKLIGYVSKSLLTSEKEDISKSRILSEGRKATQQDFDRWTQLVSHFGAIRNFINETPGFLGNKECDYYYKNLAKTAKKQKLQLWKLGDAKSAAPKRIPANKEESKKKK